jgi:hypothetical protein
MTLSNEALYREAHAAGHAAATAAVPDPMMVYEADLLTGAPRPGCRCYYVPEGLCGFAWVNVKPGTSRFARWLRTTGKGRTDSYYGGVTVWVSGYGQSHARKVAYAEAFAKVLTDHGVRAYADDRLD